jgi:hypothetical protein
MRTIPASLFLGTWLIYLAFLPAGIYSVDGNSMLAVADSLVARHSVTVPDGLGVIGPDGKSYSTWYPLQSLLAVPVVSVAIVAAHTLHLPDHYVEAMSVLVLPALYTAATVPLVHLIALQLGSESFGAWLAALAYAFGTIAMVYARDFFAEPLLTLLIAALLLLAFRNDAKSLWIIAALSALTVLAKPTALLAGPIISVYLFAKKRSLWSSSLPTIGTAVGLALYCAYNYYRFGNLVQFGPRLEGPKLAPSLSHVPQGIVGQLLSPGAGLFWYCPCVVLAILGFRRLSPTKLLEALAITCFFVYFLTIPSLWIFWNGGWSWGPRYLLPALPGLVALTSLTVRKSGKALLALGLCGFLLSAPMLVSFVERYLAEANEQGTPVSELLWAPSRSPLVNAWPAALREIHDARRHDVRVLFRDRGAPSQTIANSRALQIVNLWWWVLPVANMPRIFGIAVSLLLLSAGIWLVMTKGRPSY